MAKIQAQVSLYPLRQNKLSGPIAEFMRVLQDKNSLQISSSAMSSIITGETADVFDGLRKAFEQVAQDCDVVMTVTASNCCPEPDDCNLSQQQDCPDDSRKK